MTRSSRAALVLALILAPAAALAQPAGPAAVEAQVRARDDAERAAAVRRDAAALEELWSEALVVNATSNRVSVGRKALLESFAARADAALLRFDRRIEHFAVEGGLALLMGEETLVPATGEPVRRRFTNVWRNEAGAWRLYWRHANVIPPAP